VGSAAVTGSRAERDGADSVLKYRHLRYIKQCQAVIPRLHDPSLDFAYRLDQT
jgi:hypothetical protein